MPNPAATAAILKALDKSSYYVVLGVPKDAPAAAIQDAFHAFALQYHPDRYVRESRESAKLAATIFKRGTEAFAVLMNPAIRTLYDAGLTRGHVRYVEGEAAQAAIDARPKVKTLEQIAGKPKAKELALRADRLLVAGKVEEARLLLTDAVQDDFENAELKARLDALFTAQGYEKLGPTNAAPAPANAKPVSVAPAAPAPPRSLEELATTPKAKELGRKADRLLAIKKFEEARLLLTDAVQDDFDNEELRERLHALYTAEGFEKL
jgi:hypothetical protein